MALRLVAFERRPMLRTRPRSTSTVLAGVFPDRFGRPHQRVSGLNPGPGRPSGRPPSRFRAAWPQGAAICVVISPRPGLFIESVTALYRGNYDPRRMLDIRDKDVDRSIASGAVSPTGAAGDTPMANQTRPGNEGSGGKKDEKNSSQSAGQDDHESTRSPDRDRRPRDAEGRFIERRRSDSQPGAARGISGNEKPRCVERRISSNHGGR